MHGAGAGLGPGPLILLWNSALKTGNILGITKDFGKLILYMNQNSRGQSKSFDKTALT